jgi:hypothetical protein
MPEWIEVVINSKPIRVVAGTSVAAALIASGEPCRVSITGEPRAPLCGMGVCFECRAIVNGTRHVRTCQMHCEAGMQIHTE